MATTATAAAYKGSQYGAVELKSLYQKYWLIGFAIAFGIHLTLVGSYYLVGVLNAEEPPTAFVKILRYSDLGPPPSITSANTPPPVSVQAPVAKPTVGAPVPVPDAEVSAEQTLATQQQMSETPAPINEAQGGAGDAGVEVRIDEDAPPADFVPVEKDPVIIKKVDPKYPEMAMRANLEGRVWVKIWVDKEGKPKQVIVMKSDAEIFNEPAVEAAKQFLFTPAYMNNGPVSVWVSVPFKFKLTGNK
jgi:protein TonB